MTEPTAAPVPTRPLPTLDDCAREPIHVPGTVQPHGGLIAFEPGATYVLHASGNLARWLPVGLLPVHGRALTDLLGEAGCASVRAALADRGGAVQHQVVDLPARPEQGQPLALEAVVHTHRGIGIVEFEPAPALQTGHDWMQSLADTVGGLHSATDLDDLVERMAQRVKRLTRFDRTMVYRFDEEANGHVIADVHEPGMESFHDLHYPAGDIPAQARAHFLSNAVRYIADVDSVPVPVWPLENNAPPQALDMTHALLRSSSPIHLQYLRNMGVASTLTISLVVDGQLWGLIACHHRTPTRLPIRLRRACYALSVSAGYMVGWNVQRRDAQAMAERLQVRARVLEAFNQVAVPVDAVIENHAVSLMRLVGATGGAFWRGGAVLPFGQWPGGERGESILAHVRRAFELTGIDLIDTEHAALEPPLRPDEARRVAGLVAIRLDGFSAAGIVWLRPEFRREVAWGGDPDKQVEIEFDAQGQPKLSPRSSFARWEIAVRGRCKPWSATDREAARSLLMLRQILTVRESLAQVSLSEREFRSLVSLQSDVYWQLDGQGDVMTMSKALPFRHGPPEGASLWALFEGVGDAAQVDALRVALAKRVPFKGLHIRSQAGGPGRQFELVLSGEPRRDAEGRTIGWHGTVSDVSAESQMQAALLEKEAAELASLEKSKFLSQISHELRTPLNAVLGFSQLLAADASLAPKHREQVEHIGRAGEWLLTMISDLMDLSAMETGKLKLTLAPVSLRLVLDNAAMFFGSESTQAGVLVRQEHAESPVWVQADATRLQQVLLNLISNALKYNHRGGEVRIAVVAEAEPGFARIEVHDTGAGLTAEQIAQLFIPFNRLGREAQRIQGTGIGLVISKQLVDAMGGRISVESRLGEGSCFAVALPSVPSPANARTETPQAMLARLTADRPRTVLYVEDDPVSALVMQALVESVPGLAFAHAETAEAGLEMALALLPSALLIDVNLPGRPGTWLLRALRAEPALRRTPCASVTADSTPDAVERLLAAGFQECLRKPIDLEATRSWLTKFVLPAA